MKKITTLLLFITLYSYSFSQTVSDTTFYTGSEDFFVVPSCVDSVFIKAWGAQGGFLTTTAGGMGGYAEGTLPVNQGDTLWLYVGGQGTNGPGGQNCNLSGGFNGGGNTGDTCCSNAGSGAGAGGGATDVRYGGKTLNDRVIVGSGGGGAGSGQVGAAGGGLTGSNGGTYQSVTATGGTQTAGGLVGGHYTQHLCSKGTDGSFGQGGTGDGNDGGGGGGGCHGGGGGPNNGGGAGGSSYIAGVINGSTTGGLRAGNGMIIIEYSQGGNIPPTVVANASDTSICLGDSVVLTGSGANTYSWNNGVTNGVYFSPTATQTYTVVGTDTANCSASDQITITVNPLPIVTYTEANDTLCSHASITLSQGTPSGGSYSGTGVSGNVFNATVAGAGTHSIIYTYTDGNNCSNSDTSDIVVVVCAGINKLAMGEFNLYPNPAKTNLNIVLAENAPSKVEIHNLLGAIVYSGNFDKKKFDINIESLESGKYFITISTKDKTSKQSFIKQ